MKPIITDQWTTTSCIAVLYILPIMTRLMKGISIRNSFLELLGQASWDIFLIQMIFFGFFSDMVYNKVLVLFQLPCCFLITLSLGVLFYRIEIPITKLVISYLR